MTREIYEMHYKAVNIMYSVISARNRHLHEFAQRVHRIEAPIGVIYEIRPPPSCMPRPFCFETVLIAGDPRFWAPDVGRKFSNVRRRRATVSGVLTVPGVLGQAL